MSSGTLEAETTTNLFRNTVHQQYNGGRALGFYMLNHLVPIILNIRQPGGTNKRGLLVFGDKTQKFIPFHDLGWVDKNCVRVYTFNIRHYITCYLPAQVGSNNQPTEPYTFNLCNYCNARVADDNGELIRQIAKRGYRRDMYIYQPVGSLQEDSGPEEMFNYQDRVISCKTKKNI